MTRSDKKEAALQEMLDERDFSDGDVIEFLADKDIDAIIRKFGEPERRTEYATAPGWKVGDGKPALAHDDPAVLQAIGRCAWARLGQREHLNAHPGRCGWCDYPTDELLKACAWSVHQSGYVVSDSLIWRGKGTSLYARSGGTVGYQNRTYREFWALEPKERQRRVEVAAGRAQEIESLIEGRNP